MSKRIYWIDNLRAIGILLVVLVHTGRVSGMWFEVYIKSFFIPLFFFVSGLLVKDSFYEEKFILVLKKMAQRLLIPYLFFSISTFFIWLFFLQNFKAQSFDPPKALIGIFYGTAVEGWISNNVALWFFTALFTTQIYFYFLFKLRNRKFLFTFMLLPISVLGYMCKAPEGIAIPWNLGISLTGLVFFTVGYILSFQLHSNDQLWIQRWYIAVILLLVFILTAFLNSTVEFYIGDYGNYFLFYIAAFSGIFLFSFISKLIPHNPVLSIIGENTLVIFSTHLLVIPLITGFLVYGLNIDKAIFDKGIGIAIIYTALATFVTVCISIFMKRFVPQVLGYSSSKKA